MDARTWTLLLNTLLLSGATCAVTLPLGTGLAWMLTRTDLPGRKAGLVLLGLMLFVPLYLQAAGWQAGFGVQGWYTLAYDVSAPLQGWSGAICVHSAAALPWVVLIVGMGMWLVEPELEEQALLDASSAQVLWRVTLRGALPAVAVAALWVAVVTAGEMTVTDLFMVRTYAEELYTRIAIGPQPEDPPLGWQPGLILPAALVAAGLLLCARILRGDRPISLRRRRVFRLGILRLPIALLAALILVLLVAVPLGNLCYKAGVVVTPQGDEWVRVWSLGKCLAVVAGSPLRYQREFGWSLLIAALAASAAVAIAIVLTWLARTGRYHLLQALAAMLACLWLLQIGTLGIGAAVAAAVASWWLARGAIGRMAWASGAGPLCLWVLAVGGVWVLGIGTERLVVELTIATGIAWLTLASGRWALPAVVAIVCLVLPGPAVGLRIIGWLNRPEIPLLVWLYGQSILAPWLALVIRSLPLTILVIWHALRTVPTEILDSAAADGAGAIRRLWSIALPARLPAVALAWLVALAVSLGDLAASMLVMPPGVTTVSIRIFNLLHSGVEDQVAGICLAMIVLFAAAAAVAAWPAAWWGKRIAGELSTRRRKGIGLGV